MRRVADRGELGVRRGRAGLGVERNLDGGRASARELVDGGGGVLGAGDRAPVPAGAQRSRRVAVGRGQHRTGRPDQRTARSSGARTRSASGKMLSGRPRQVADGRHAAEQDGLGSESSMCTCRSAAAGIRKPGGSRSRRRPGPGGPPDGRDPPRPVDLDVGREPARPEPGERCTRIAEVELTRVVREARRHAGLAERLSSLRRSWTSSRRRAAYSNRRSFAASCISSSRLWINRPSSSMGISGARACRRRSRSRRRGLARRRATAGCRSPSCGSSAGRCRARCCTRAGSGGGAASRRWRAFMESVTLSAYISTCRRRCAPPGRSSGSSEVSERRNPSLSASRIATSETSGRSRPSRSRLMPTRTSNSPSRRSRSDLDPLDRVDLRVQVPDPDPHLDEVVGQVLGHLLRERGDEHALVLLGAEAGSPPSGRPPDPSSGGSRPGGRRGRSGARSARRRASSTRSS